MIATVLATVQLLRALASALVDPATRGVVLLTALTLGIGTVFYVRAEGWSVIDALYFSVVTLTTIGFGDLVPTSAGTKLFTVVYSLVGIGLIASFVTTIALHARRQDAQLPRRRRGRERPGGGVG